MTVFWSISENGRHGPCRVWKRTSARKWKLCRQTAKVYLLQILNIWKHHINKWQIKWHHIMSNLNSIWSKKYKFSSITTCLNTSNAREWIILTSIFCFHHLCNTHYFCKCNRMDCLRRVAPRSWVSEMIFVCKTCWIKEVNIKNSYSRVKMLTPPHKALGARCWDWFP